MEEPELMTLNCSHLEPKRNEKNELICPKCKTELCKITINGSQGHRLYSYNAFECSECNYRSQAEHFEWNKHKIEE